MSSVFEWLQSAGLERHARAFDGVSDAAFAGLLMQVSEVEEGMKTKRRKRAMNGFLLVPSPLRLRGRIFFFLSATWPTVNRGLSRKLREGECSFEKALNVPFSGRKKRERKRRPWEGN